MGKSIVVIGSSNTDMILKAARLPKPGETIIGGKFSTAAGGKGANQAVSAARAGGEVTLIARVGDDMFGEEAVQGFTRDGINVDNIIRDKNAPSGVALIFVDKMGENSIGVASGANANLSPDDIRGTENVISAAEILLMQLETPVETVEAATDIAAKHNVRIILNPAPAQELSNEFLKKVSVVTPNETEAELLTGIKVEDEKSAEHASRILSEKGIETVLITLGAEGVYAASPEFNGIIPGFEVDAVDTTAAGDVFNGVLAVSLAEGKSLTEAVRFANAAGALSVMTLGAQTSAPSRMEIESFIKDRG